MSAQHEVQYWTEAVDVTHELQRAVDKSATQPQQCGSAWGIAPFAPADRKARTFRTLLVARH